MDDETDTGAPAMDDDDYSAMSPECEDLCDAVAGMSVDDIEAELEASGRFQDPAAVAKLLLSMAEPAPAV